ncbi:Aldehyde dehydrogenase [hydrothermal vent metagenome]|uniref:Aldehyde dehydrogenase n=1 Tax=hydrothermal vent metagenome TaxID=652676 RepID=A0A3B1D2J4_9ZZZZ
MNTMGDIKQYNLLIDGKVVSSADEKYFDTINPSTGNVFAQVANANVSDMEAAIKSARTAYDSGLWTKMSVAERGIYLKKIASLIRKNAKELADLETADIGKTVKQASLIDVVTAADCFEYFSSVSDAFNTRENKVDMPVKSMTEIEPMGVVGAIIPWNYPLIMAAWKLAPALITGNTIILKPSPLGCVSVMRLAQIMVEAGLPEGVVNIIASDNVEVSENLVKSLYVDMISFTGGTETGKAVMKLSSNTLKKVTLELGGKSPNIVFADCDMSAAIGGTLTAIFMNQGQMCTAGSRLFIEESIYDEFLAKLVEKTRKLKIGDAADYQTSFGPLVSREHRDKVLAVIEQAVNEGAKIECGGKIPEGLDRGAYLEPTILSNVDNSMVIAQEEVFGPVLCVMKFLNSSNVGRIANDSQYGLAACIWTKDENKAQALAKKLQCGTVWINTYGGFFNQAPFGGYKQSGIGRELGLEGLLEYTQSKHICTDKTPGGKSLVSFWF